MSKSQEGIVRQVELLLTCWHNRHIVCGFINSKVHQLFKCRICASSVAIYMLPVFFQNKWLIHSLVKNTTLPIVHDKAGAQTMTHNGRIMHFAIAAQCCPSHNETFTFLFLLKTQFDPLCMFKSETCPPLWTYDQIKLSFGLSLPAVLVQLLSNSHDSLVILQAEEAVHFRTVGWCKTQSSLSASWQGPLALPFYCSIWRAAIKTH